MRKPEKEKRQSRELRGPWTIRRLRHHLLCTSQCTRKTPPPQFPSRGLGFLLHADKLNPKVLGGRRRGGVLEVSSFTKND